MSAPEVGDRVRVMVMCPEYPRVSTQKAQMGPLGMASRASRTSTTTAASQARITPPIAVSQAATPSCGLMPPRVSLLSRPGPNQLRAAA